MNKQKQKHGKRRKKQYSAVLVSGRHYLNDGPHMIKTVDGLNKKKKKKRRRRRRRKRRQ